MRLSTFNVCVEKILIENGLKMIQYIVLWRGLSNVDSFL